MDVSEFSRAELQLHEAMASELGDAIRSSDVNAVQALFERWNGVHEERRNEVRRLKQAIRQAQNHFKFAEAEQLQERLARLE